MKKKERELSCEVGARPAMSWPARPSFSLMVKTIFLVAMATMPQKLLYRPHTDWNAELLLETQAQILKRVPL